MTMRWMGSAAMIAAMMSTGVCGANRPHGVRPKRSVMLLDFSRSPAPDTQAPQPDDMSSIDQRDITRVMASQFTGAPIGQDVGYASAVSMPQMPTFAPSQLGNPFVTYALSTRPMISPAVYPGSTASGCDVPSYQPSFAFGRQAEERRRTIFPMVYRAACEVGLPVGLFDAMIMQESRYRPTAISPKGAIGLAQLMPGTASQLGVDAYSLLDNLRGGARYLKSHVTKFGRYDLGLAAYNAGPGRVQRNWAVPRIAETQGYVRAIMGNWRGTLSSATMPVSTIGASDTRPLPYRRAQLIFMSQAERGL
jgi:hypothetical protein